MNSEKAPGSDEWVSPTPMTKINLIAELTQKKSTSCAAPGSERWKMPHTAKRVPDYYDRQTDTSNPKIPTPGSTNSAAESQLAQSHHAIIGIFFALVFAVILIYGTLVSSFSDDLQRGSWDNYYGNFVTLSASFNESEIIIDAHASVYGYSYTTEAGRLDYLLLAPGLLYIYNNDPTNGMFRSASIEGDILCFSPGILTTENEYWIR